MPLAYKARNKIIEFWVTYILLSITVDIKEVLIYTCTKYNNISLYYQPAIVLIKMYNLWKGDDKNIYLSYLLYWSLIYGQWNSLTLSV